MGQPSAVSVPSSPPQSRVQQTRPAQNQQTKFEAEFYLEAWQLQFENTTVCYKFCGFNILTLHKVFDALASASGKCVFNLSEFEKCRSTEQDYKSKYMISDYFVARADFRFLSAKCLNETYTSYTTLYCNYPMRSSRSGM